MRLADVAKDGPKPVGADRNHGPTALYWPNTGYLGFDRLCGTTGTVLGPGFFPGPLWAGVFGVDRLWRSTRTVFLGIDFLLTMGRE